MVPTPVRCALGLRRSTAAALAGSLSLIVAAGCGRADDATPADTSAAGRVSASVRAQYGGRDAVAAGAWIWTGLNGAVWVLVDVQSTVPEVVQSRVELWVGDSAGVVRVGRSDIMPATAEFGAYAFDDITGDGMPDLFGYVADSAGVSYPVFIPGARGAMADVLEEAGRGYQFATDDANVPSLFAGPLGPCALQLWAEASPDSAPPGWRYLALGPRGTLMSPSATLPSCQ